MENFESAYGATCELVSREIALALGCVDTKNLEHMVARIQSADKVFFVGVGRVLLSLQAIAKRLSHLGIETHVVGEITEPAITAEDLLIVGSGSGMTLFPVAIARRAKSIGATVVHMGSNPKGDMSEIADFMVRVPVRTKLCLPDEIDSQQPMTSLFEQALLVLGDVIAKMIIDERHIDLANLWRRHANLE